MVGFLWRDRCYMWEFDFKEQMNKQCTRCKKVKELEKFKIDRKRSDGRGSWCKECMSLIANKWNKSHRDRTRESVKRYYRKTHPERIRMKIEKSKKPKKVAITSKERYENNKSVFFKTYGNKCECCGETETIFLTIDHINGQAGKKRDSAAQAYAKAIKKYNPNEYRILCHNCNHAVRFGICPHQKFSS